MVEVSLDGADIFRQPRYQNRGTHYGIFNPTALLEIERASTETEPPGLITSSISRFEFEFGQAGVLQCASHSFTIPAEDSSPGIPIHYPVDGVVCFV